MRWGKIVAGCAAAALMGPVAQASAAQGWTGYVVNSGNDTVAQFNTATNAPIGTAIVTPAAPVSMAITPNGSTGYVTNSGDGSVTPIALAAGTPATAIDIGDTPEGIAITPNGQTALVAEYRGGGIRSIDLATGAVGPLLDVTDPWAVAISPDGSTAYVTSLSGGSVTPISLATDYAAGAIQVGTSPVAIAITPNGSTAYVANSGGDSVTPINLATDTAEPSIATGLNSEPDAIAIAPDGATAYVADDGTGAVTPIDIATNTAQSPIVLDGGQASPTAIAITPDGKTAYVTDPADAAIDPINLTSDTPETPIDDGNGSPAGLAITPDQAPTAAFSVVAASPGQATSFDASASTSPVGAIAEYEWNFGDGQTATTTAPTTSHVYATSGSYTASLTVVNSAGTSLSQVFTGQTASLQGGPSAAVSHAVTVLAVPTSLPAPVVTPPPAKLAGLRVTAGSTAGRLSHGRCVAAAPKLRHDKSCRRPGLLRIRYTLTRASAVTVTIARTAPGRSVKGRCVAVTRANRGRHACVRVTRTLGSITETAAAGARTLTLPARIGGHTLGPGTYRLTVTPSGGTPHTKTFRISG